MKSHPTRSSTPSPGAIGNGIGRNSPTSRALVSPAMATPWLAADAVSAASAVKVSVEAVTPATS